MIQVTPSVWHDHADQSLSPVVSFRDAVTGHVFFSIEARHADQFIQSVRVAAALAQMGSDQLREGENTAPGLLAAQAGGRA